MVHAVGFDPDKRITVAYRAAASPSTGLGIAQGHFSPSMERSVQAPKYISYYGQHDTRQLSAHDAFRGNTFQHNDKHTMSHRFHPGVAVKEPKRASYIFASSQPRFPVVTGMRELHAEERMGSVLRKTLSTSSLTRENSASLSSPQSVGRVHASPLANSSTSLARSGTRLISPVQPIPLKPQARPPSRSAMDSGPSFLSPKFQHDTFFKPRV